MTASSSSYNIDTKKGQKFWLLGDVSLSLAKATDHDCLSNNHNQRN